MAIIQLQENYKLPETVDCAICGKSISPIEAIVGLRDAEGQQQFACNGHFWNPRQFITGWADFLAANRAKRTESQFVLEYGEGQDARALR